MGKDQTAAGTMAKVDARFLPSPCFGVIAPERVECFGFGWSNGRYVTASPNPFGRILAMVHNVRLRQVARWCPTTSRISANLTGCPKGASCPDTALSGRDA